MKPRPGASANAGGDGVVATSAEGDAGTDKFAPQPPQNRLSGAFKTPHCVHLVGSAAPHCVQKRPLSEFSA
jgi:hypothetical protein